MSGQSPPENLQKNSNHILTAEAVSRTGYTPSHIVRLCHSGKVTAKQVDRIWYIDQFSLEEFLKDKEEKKKAASEKKRREYEAAINEKALKQKQELLSKKGNLALAVFVSLAIVFSTQSF